jgi:hypothetical protein
VAPLELISDGYEAIVAILGAAYVAGESSERDGGGRK